MLSIQHLLKANMNSCAVTYPTCNMVISAQLNTLKATRPALLDSPIRDPET